MYLTESDIKIVKDGIRKNNPEIPFICNFRFSSNRGGNRTKAP